MIESKVRHAIALVLKAASDHSIGSPECAAAVDSAVRVAMGHVAANPYASWSTDLLASHVRAASKHRDTGDDDAAIFAAAADRLDALYHGQSSPSPTACTIELANAVARHLGLNPADEIPFEELTRQLAALSSSPSSGIATDEPVETRRSVAESLGLRKNHPDCVALMCGRTPCANRPCYIDDVPPSNPPSSGDAPATPEDTTDG